MRIRLLVPVLVAVLAACSAGDDDFGTGGDVVETGGWATVQQPADRVASIEGFERIGRINLYAYGSRLWEGTLGPNADGESYAFSFHPSTGLLTVAAPDGAAPAAACS